MVFAYHISMKIDIKESIQEPDGASAVIQAETELTLLEHIDRIVKQSLKKGLTKAFYGKAQNSIVFAGEKLGLNPTQTILFSHFLNRCDNQAIQIEDIAESLKCGNIQVLQFMNDIDELEKKKFILCCRNPRAVSYRVPFNVINSIRKNGEFKNPGHENYTIDEFFDAAETLFEQRTESELSFELLGSELDSLINSNQQLQITQKLILIGLENDDLILLLFFCLLYINNSDDHISFYDFEDLYEHKTQFRRVKRSLRDGDHELLERNLIEYTFANGFSDRESFKLTDQTKEELLDDLHINKRQEKQKKGLLATGSIVEKKLFFNGREEENIQRLASLLKEENFRSVQRRLTEKGMRTGFACLFSGPPGTGKTETAYQLARLSGRDIMAVDLAETKSCWFGESEKRIKEIFTRYKGFVENSEIAPILLFNEADGVIGKRKEIGGASQAVDQTENTIQNIILEELEKLTGILIATTNLRENLDKAFERRFLYKIEFDKPGLETRTAIWNSMLPLLSKADLDKLASRFDFSGGQIENISRKSAVESVLTGIEPSAERLAAFCREEQMGREDGHRIGFGS
ncbi:hypothetical protein FACS1894151_04000 [Spirochaetia bacterium]|nr:hypothetical protein FACS1894151_04000 [Spirochaetia bacterium]